MMIKHLLIPFFAAVSAQLAGACDTNLEPDPRSIVSATWAEMITDMGAEKTATQKMAKAYLFIRTGDVDTPQQRYKLKTGVAEFDDKLQKFYKGYTDSDGYVHYSKPPLEMICNGIEDLIKYWPNMREVLYPATYADAVIDYDDDLMGNLTHWSYFLMKKVDAVERMYVSVAQFYSPATPGQTIELAERQSMLSQRLTKEALLVYLDWDVQNTLVSMQSNVVTFEQTHDGLLKGIVELGLPPLAARCTLWEMRKVTEVWFQFKPSVQNILDTERALKHHILSVDSTNMELFDEMNKAVALFVQDFDACDDYVNSYMLSTKYGPTLWANGINEAGRGQMFSQKSARLIFQIAQPNPANLKVDQAELVDTLAVGLWTLNTLIEGSVALSVPSLPTQELATEFVYARTIWDKFSSLIMANSQDEDKVPPNGEIINRVAVLREYYFDQMATTVDKYVAVAQAMAPAVHAEIIFISGRQRSLQCNLASVTLTIDLGCRPDHHRKLAAEVIALYNEVHWRLLNGRKDENGNYFGNFPRTTDSCILDQMLKVIDSWGRIQGITGLVSASSRDTSSKDDLQSFHEIINAGYGIMNTAVEMYIARGKDESQTCVLTPAPEEWDSVFTELSHLREYLPKITKDFLFTMKGLNTTDGDIYLKYSMGEVEDTLHHLVYGYTAGHIPTPPSQAVADKIFQVVDAYHNLAPIYKMAPDASSEDVVTVATKSKELFGYVQELYELYIDDAWEKDKTVESARLNASGTLLYALEDAQKQVAFLMFDGCTPCKAEGSTILKTIELFEETYNLLMDGNAHHTESHRRLSVNATKYTVRATEEINLIQMLNEMKRTFTLLKPVLETIATELATDGTLPTAEKLVETGDVAKAAVVAAEASDAVYSSTSRTTTSIELDILTPLSLTGDWNIGRTMRTAARFAENLINYQQMILPGYAIKNRFFDDLGDSQEGMRLVLQESASVTTEYVALGGMGKSDVCANAAFAAASMNMPFLSYECSGRELSNEVEYEGFTRMGTPLTQTLDMISSIATGYKWAEIAIVSGDPGQYRDEVDYYQAGLANLGIATSAYASFDTTIDETVGMVAGVVADKRRQIMLIGTETFMRRVICGTRVAGANLGVTWLYEGIMSDKWWTQTDDALVNAQPECTAAAITESFQGAINFAGLGKALPNEEGLNLDCFDGYTSPSFLELLDQHLVDGYPTVGDNETMVARPYMELRAHTADGVCALAKTIAHFLADDHTVDDLRNPSTQLYLEFVNYLKLGLAFQGVSGYVNFTGNDKPETVAMKQVIGEEFVTIGMAFVNGTMVMDMHGGLSNASWTAAKEDVEEDFPWLVFKILTPLLCVCCPAVAGCVRQS